MRKTCCFFGHRKINTTELLKTKLYSIIENLIKEEGIDTFLFGSKSQFNDLCYQLVCQLKEVYPHIKRGYVRAEYPDIDTGYENFLLSKYEFTYYPDSIFGKASYVQRNYNMIDKSKVCIIYFDKNYIPENSKNNKTSLKGALPKSGTLIAYNHAVKKKKEIINLMEIMSK